MNFKAATPRFVDLRQDLIRSDVKACCVEGRRVIFEKKMKK